MVMVGQTLSALLSVMVDVFGRNSQASAAPAKASEISDLIDFL